MIVARPDTLAEALALMAQAGPPWTPLAGGTDLFVSWPARPTHDSRFLDLSRIAELRGISLTPSHVELGALATYWDVISDARIAAAFPLLAAAAKQVGAIQIQTRGTWAGNIANGSPAADGVPVLMAYDATVVLRSVAGCREVPLESYYTGYKRSLKRPEELIVAVRVPCRPRRREWFHKVGARSAQAITKVGVAAVQYDLSALAGALPGPDHDPGAWRIVASSVAPCVRRCRHFEATLNAAPDVSRRFASPDEIRKILTTPGHTPGSGDPMSARPSDAVTDADIAPIDDIRSTAEYRSAVLARLLFHFFRAEN